MAEWSRVARRIRVPLGFAFAILYFWLARPAWRSLALGSVLIVLGLLLRAWASGNVRKDEALATSGPYAYTRNPLYLGSLLIGIGFAVAARYADNRNIKLAAVLCRQALQGMNSILYLQEICFGIF